ncbi:MAG TPA: hypothetical protein EYM38_01200 [Dehalococcoidia bacterium]|nr:hypothetical protein [Dehalococcoidia bacterium]
MAGSNFTIFNVFPEAPRKGNGTALWVIDDQTPQEHRPVIEAMIQEATPISIFFSLTPNFLGVPLRLLRPPPGRDTQPDVHQRHRRVAAYADEEFGDREG